ncbi:hypothetical protein Q7P37_000722 [Cladosporium fusiforme]
MNAGGEPTDALHGVKRKRASREGLPKRFPCQHPGCDKRYSRAEHLQRHALNHSSNPLYRCRQDGCRQHFVRQDLFERHVARQHTSDQLQASPAMGSTEIQESTILPDTSSSQLQQHVQPHTSTQIPMDDTGTFLVDETALSSADWTLAGDASIADPSHSGDNFASWLLSPQAPHGWDLDLTPLLFTDYAVDSGVGLSNRNNIGANQPEMAPATDSPGILFHTANIETETSTSIDTMNTARGHDRIPYRRIQEMKSLILGFRCRNASNILFVDAAADSLLFRSVEGDLPNVSVTVIDQCISSFWADVAQEIPILHHATFSNEHCPALLLLGMVSLGAAQLVRRSAIGVLRHYRNFADMIITSVRWEIYTHDDAQPPVKLWVAQALLLLEFYEKMYSSRRLHERAHIHHVSTLTLLRRGSPLGGQPGTEVRVDTSTSVSRYPSREQSEKPQVPPPDPDLWWGRWAKTESMLRVVFAAYEMDTLHAMMFGHESSLFPYDVSLPLPCDDVLWTATSADQVLGIETTFRMQGIKSMKFLDGLKRYLHGNDVQSHQHARQILLVGLLNIGWHIRHQEKHMQLIDSAPAQEERTKWTRKVLRALDRWKRSLTEALESIRPRRTTEADTRMIAKPHTLYRLAYITMHIDIIDCQMLAGSKLLLGRHVSERERAGAASRAKAWVGTADAKLAVSNAFCLLWETLFLPYVSTEDGDFADSRYSSRSDHCVYRPWSLYLAALAIWMYNYAKSSNVTISETVHSDDTSDRRQLVYEYISKHAELDEPETVSACVSKSDCIALLQYLADDLATAEPEILTEASKRLRECCNLLCSSA